jgi:hypothetical protein
MNGKLTVRYAAFALAVFAFTACSLGGDIDAWRAKAVGDSDNNTTLDPIFPYQPQNVRITENSAYNLSVRWDSVRDADYYHLFISDYPYFDYEYAIDCYSTSFSITPDWWSYFDMVYITVCAYKYGYGEGSYSTSVSVSRPSGLAVNATQLSANQWVYHSINSSASNSYNLHSLYVNAWQTYYIWWNDRDNDRDNDGGTLDIQVMASVSADGSSGVFFDQDRPNEASFTPSSSGTVYIKVRPLSSGSTGSYGIAYSTSNSRP